MNAGDLIGQILQSGMARGAHTRMQRGAGSQPGLGGLLGGLLGGSGGGSGGGLGDLLGGRSGGRASSGGGLGGLAGMASDYLSGGGRGHSSYRQGGMSGGGSLGGLVGSMLGGGRSSGMLGGAAMGVIGMIAMNALRNFGQSQAAAPAAQTPQAAPAAQPGQAQPAAASPEDVPAPSEDTQRLMLMAMISAAKADGHVDDAEMNNIVGKLKENGADAEERDWVLRELAKPMDLDVLVAAVPSIEVAAQVYAASALAITPDTPQEQDYLNQLSAKLGLQPAVRAYIHQALGLPAPA